MYDIIQPIFPETVRAFDDYVRFSQKFSRMEMEILTKIVKNALTKEDFSAIIENCLESQNESRMGKREVSDFISVFYD